MLTRTAKAQWQGDLPKGKGAVELGSGAFSGAYSFGSRFEDGPGTNPEELIGAAHAGCFSMALANALGQQGFTPTSVHTEAKVGLEKGDEGFAITTITLVTEAVVPEVTQETFAEVAEQAKQGCPVSKALAGVKIGLQATLKNS